MKKTLKKAIIAITAIALVSASVAFSAFADVAVTADYSANKQVTLTITGAETGKQVTVLVLKPDTTEVLAETIAYINQDAAVDGGKEYKFDGTNLELTPGEYEVRVGGDGIDGFKTAKFTVGGSSDATPAPTVDPSQPTPTVDPSQPTVDPSQPTPTVDPTKPTDDPTKPTTEPGKNPPIGDVNDDTEWDGSDALDILLRATKQIPNFTASGEGVLEEGAVVHDNVGDVNLDGEIDGSDALDVLLRATKQISEFERKSVDDVVPED